MGREPSFGHVVVFQKKGLRVFDGDNMQDGRGTKSAMTGRSALTSEASVAAHHQVFPPPFPSLLSPPFL
jgi:hypothetical protein